jgi:hypothetical protein
LIQSRIKFLTVFIFQRTIYTPNKQWIINRNCQVFFPSDQQIES